jgi:WD40 repeat protein
MGYELEESMKLLGDDYRDYLSDDEIAYIEKSESQDKKSRFKKRMLLFGLVILTATSIFFGGYAKYQEELANEATLNVQKTLRNSLMEKGRIFQDNPLISKLLFAKALTQEMSRRNKSSDTVLKILYNSFYDIELEEASDDENNSDFGKTTDFMRLDTNTTELEAIGEIKRNFDELNITVSGELLSHNRDYLAVWFNSQIELWSLKEKRVVNHFLHNGRVKQVIFSSDDSKIAARSYIEGTIGIWDTKSGFILSLFKEFPNANGIEFSKNGKELLCWGGDKSFLTQFKKPLAKVVLWDIYNNRVKAVFSHDDWIYGATFHNNEKEIWSWGYDRVLKILDKQSGKLLFKLYVKVPIYKVAFEENSNRFYTLSLGSKIKKAWSIYPKEREFNLEHTSKMIGLSFTKNGKRVLSWDNSGLIQLWKRKGFVKLASFRHHRAVWSAQFSKDEKYILAWGKDGLVRKWEIERGEEVEGEHTIEKKADIYELKTEREQISWRRGELEVIDLKEGTKVSLFHDTTVRLAHLNKKENLLLSCDQNSVNLWDIETKSKLLTFSHTDVIDAKFSDDEREIMSWGYDGNIKVFKLYKDRTLEFKDYLLEAEVHNGVELYNGRVNPLSVKEWKKRKSQYEERLK